ncbi:MAG: class I SAM-dependent rRNA methyltransferase [Verrucomicrobiales bacterium]|nr:class I SAM-dependent rRNA methyltransferase [Verrucomicrobiales bacterium]
MEPTQGVVEAGANVLGPEIGGALHEFLRALELGQGGVFTTVVPGGLRELLEENGQFVHVIRRGHLAQEIRRGQCTAQDAFPVVAERYLARFGADAGALDHVLDRLDVLPGEPLHAEAFGRELGAAPHVDRRVLGTGALGIALALQIAGVVQQDGQQTQLELVPVEPRFHAGEVAVPEQPGEAEGALQGVLDVVVKRIDREVIRIPAGKAVDHHAEGPGHDQPVPFGEQAQIDELNLVGNRRRVARVFGSEHAPKLVQGRPARTRKSAGSPRCDRLAGGPRPGVDSVFVDRASQRNRTPGRRPPGPFGPRPPRAADRAPKWERKVWAPPPESAAWPVPWVQLRYFSNHPHVYPTMIGAVSDDAAPGDLVSVFGKDGKPFGVGLWNATARVPLRVIHHGDGPADEALVLRHVEAAVRLRQEVLRLPERTDAYRVIHSDGDRLSGLVVDRYQDTLSIEIHSRGIYRRLPQWLPLLHQRLGTRRERIVVEPAVARMEGFEAPAVTPLGPVRFREHGVRYEVDFASGHKTGFFCDQRENRRRLAEFTRGRRVLDLCCYTGGFAVAAKVLGEAAEVTGVDLDEAAVAQARRNANLNQARIRWVHADAFAFARQMQQNGEQFDVVVLDPPKLIETREEAPEGLRKYEDLNALAMRLLAPDGLLVTCSCSGLLEAEEFERMVIRMAHRLDLRLQILDRTGAGPDHPVLSNCPESRYLKLLWTRRVG